MPNGATETTHEHSEHWELASVETAEWILGHAQPGSGFTPRQTDSGQQCCLHYIQMFDSSRAIVKTYLTY